MVVELALLTEDRDNDEQRALLMIARRVDSDINVLNSANCGPGKMWREVARGVFDRQLPESRLEEAAHRSRVVEPPQRAVKLAAVRPKPYAGLDRYVDEHLRKQP